jgi:hypothetical protein
MSITTQTNGNWTELLNMRSPALHSSPNNPWGRAHWLVHYCLVTTRGVVIAKRSLCTASLRNIHRESRRGLGGSGATRYIWPLLSLVVALRFIAYEWLREFARARPLGLVAWMKELRKCPGSHNNMPGTALADETNEIVIRRK